MAVPDFQTLMRPLLVIVEDGQQHDIATVRERLADQFELSAEDREERIPSGRVTRLQNRVGWAATYLYRCGLLDRPRRAHYRITQRGREVLSANPDRVDLSVLEQFPELKDSASAARCLLRRRSLRHRKRMSRRPRRSGWRARMPNLDRRLPRNCSTECASRIGDSSKTWFSMCCARWATEESGEQQNISERVVTRGLMASFVKTLWDSIRSRPGEELEEGQGCRASRDSEVLWGAAWQGREEGRLHHHVVV